MSLNIKHLLLPLMFVTLPTSAYFEGGYGLGMVTVASKDRPLHTFQLGFTHDKYKIGVDAIYNIVPTNTFSTNTSNQYVRGAKLLAKSDLKLGPLFFASAKGGIGYHKIGSNKLPQAAHRSETFPAFMVGLGFMPNKTFNVALNVNHDKRKDVKFKDSTYPSMNFNYIFTNSRASA